LRKLRKIKISISKEPASDQVLECRALLADAPDSEFIRHRLAVNLYRDQQYPEAAIVASQVAPAELRTARAPVGATKLDALKELVAATKRVRPFVAEEAKLIPGEGAFSHTMQAFDMGISMFEKELALEESKS